MTKYHQLTKDQRENIQYMLDKGIGNFTQIASVIKVDRTTIAKEIKRNRYVRSYFYQPDDFKGINRALETCHKLSVPPYVCNYCPTKGKCNRHHLYYKATQAQKHYLDTLKFTRVGINITQEAIEVIEANIVPLMKLQKQSVNQLFINHPDLLYFSKATFYKYIHNGVLSLNDMDLPKKVSYKPRKQRFEVGNKRELALLKDRSYKDYLEFIIKNPDISIVQMDTVIGTINSNKVLLTLLLLGSNFMIIRLLDKKNIASVNQAFDHIKHDLSITDFFKIFAVILTDNGSEFFDPSHIEYDYSSGVKKGNVFYCQPYSSWQKGSLEKNHEYIRKVFPKGTSFDNFTDKQIQLLQDNINNIPRDSLGGQTPHNLADKLYPQLITKLGCSFIKPDDVSLNRKDFKR